VMPGSEMLEPQNEFPRRSREAAVRWEEVHGRAGNEGGEHLEEFGGVAPPAPFAMEPFDLTSQEDRISE
jgi:hypothetical protein